MILYPTDREGIEMSLIMAQPTVNTFENSQWSHHNNLQLVIFLCQRQGTRHKMWRKNIILILILTHHDTDFDLKCTISTKPNNNNNRKKKTQ